EIKVEALLQCGVEAPQRTMEDASPWDLWDEAGSVQVPTLLLAADPTQGSLVPAARGTELARENDSIEFVLVEGASHSMHRDSYDRFMSLIRTFVAG
ncbi:MAG: alpha/beta hydrolase, partial [Acidimicrobiia bacterium]|nr:alpha/beta hydrolase [Acidimicrobiia bacterium]MDX2466001.1 alpha/beta hydrolase [Acidimicrobiia bacterium]